MSANTWGQELRAARKAERDTQEQAALKLGINRGHLSNLELDKTDPSVEVARRALKHYHVPLRLLEIGVAEERREQGAAA